MFSHSSALQITMSVASSLLTISLASTALAYYGNGDASGINFGASYINYWETPYCAKADRLYYTDTLLG